MDATPLTWSKIAEDNPIALLARRTLQGEKVLVARVKLAKGCHVALHTHHNEQIALVLSGRVRWTLGAENSPERRELEMGGEEVLILPSQFPHGVDALEDTEIIDILSPPGPMGVDSQGR